MCHGGCWHVQVVVPVLWCVMVRKAANLEVPPEGICFFRKRPLPSLLTLIVAQAERDAQNENTFLVANQIVSLARSSRVKSLHAAVSGRPRT